MDNRHEPESCYRTQMEAVKASARLKGSVMDEVRRERCAAEAVARAAAPGRAPSAPLSRSLCMAVRIHLCIC